MSSDLSPQSFQYLNEVVANGMFPSVKDALDAAVDALRRESKRLPMVPDEHRDAVEEALADLEAGDEGEEWDLEEQKRRFRERLVKRQSSGGA